ncbi:MAG: DUF3786 domain-containing protein [Planctomycetes bacterium]|nr:DUF3786 domain-containing protein [Planctomycetota bacterium]
MPNSPPEPKGIAVPPRQHNLDEAAARAFVLLRTQPAEQLQWLGAVRTGDLWTLPVLGETLRVDLERNSVVDSTSRAVGPWWRVLVLHYLAERERPEPRPPTLTFANLPGGRAYASVYQQRVIDSLCRKAGRDADTLRQAAAALGVAVLRDSATGAFAPATSPAGDLALEFAAFPRVTVQLVWYCGDEELPPSATLLMPTNIETFFCLEDIIVLSERLVARLAGGRF